MSTPEFPTLDRGWDSPAEFRLHEERIPGGRMLAVTGEFDIATVPELRERLDAAVDAGARRLVLDLSDISFMDSVAMAAILHTRTRMGEQGRIDVVVPESSYTRLVFEIAGLPRCLNLHESRAAAGVSWGSGVAVAGAVGVCGSRLCVHSARVGSRGDGKRR